MNVDFIYGAIPPLITPVMQKREWTRRVCDG